MEYTKYLCLTRRYFGGTEQVSLEDFIKTASEQGVDAESNVTAWLRNGMHVAILPEMYERADYTEISEYTIADQALFQNAVNQQNMIDSVRDHVADARDEDIFRLIELVHEGLSSRATAAQRQNVILEVAKTLGIKS